MVSRSAIGPWHKDAILPGAIQRSQIEHGVFAIAVCPACGRAQMQANGFSSYSCFLGHPDTRYEYFVAIRAEQVADDLPERWALRPDLIEVV